MSNRLRILPGIVVCVGLAAAGWYWWQARRVELYGGVKPFMKKLQSLQQATTTELARSRSLPQDYEQMEQLSQDAQDVFAVFRNDPREKDPRFGPLANFFGWASALMPLGIRPTLGQGAFWGQVLQRTIEDWVDRCEYVLTMDYDTFFSKEDVEQIVLKRFGEPRSAEDEANGPSRVRSRQVQQRVECVIDSGKDR